MGHRIGRSMTNFVFAGKLQVVKKACKGNQDIYIAVESEPYRALCTEHATDHQEVGPFQGLPCGTYASTMATSGTLWRFKDEDTGKYLPNRDELRRATCNLAPG